MTKAAGTRAVAGASPLIYLARLGLLGALPRFYEVVLVPAEVVEEVVAHGKQLGRADAWAIDAALAAKHLVAAVPAPPLPGLPASLGSGERAVIAKALRERCDALVDDREGCAVARALGVRPRRTTALLLEGVARGFWDVARFEELLAKLSGEGYFLTADVFRDLVQHARELGPGRA